MYVALLFWILSGKKILIVATFNLFLWNSRLSVPVTGHIQPVTQCLFYSGFPPDDGQDKRQDCVWFITEAPAFGERAWRVTAHFNVLSQLILWTNEIFTPDWKRGDYYKIHENVLMFITWQISHGNLEYSVNVTSQ